MRTPYLKCTKCDKQWPLDSGYQRCDTCREPIEIVYDRLFFTEKDFGTNGSLTQRYAKILPFDRCHEKCSLGEGNTPLLRAWRLSETLGLEEVYLKNETVNPTWSFKDRGTVCAVEHVLDSKVKRIGAVSTGNMASSVGAYAARSGLDSVALVSANMSDEKLAPITMYTKHVIRVNGDYGELYYRSLDLGQQLGIYFSNCDDPFRVEGQKTVIYETYQQLGFQSLDCVLLPVSSGGNLCAVIKGLEEMLAASVIKKKPLVIGVQAEGCSPITQAFCRGEVCIERFEEPKTIAHAIANPYPPSGNRVLRKIQEIAGIMMSVNDAEIKDAQLLLARTEGVFGQFAACVPIAAIRKATVEGIIDRNQKTVVIITGSGIKNVLVDHKSIHGVVESDLMSLKETLRQAIDID